MSICGVRCASQKRKGFVGKPSGIWIFTLAGDWRQCFQAFLPGLEFCGLLWGDFFRTLLLLDPSPSIDWSFCMFHAWTWTRLASRCMNIVLFPWGIFGPWISRAESMCNGSSLSCVIGPLCNVTFVMNIIISSSLLAWHWGSSNSHSALLPSANRSLLSTLIYIHENTLTQPSLPAFMHFTLSAQSSYPASVTVTKTEQLSCPAPLTVTVTSGVSVLARQPSQAPAPPSSHFSATKATSASSPAATSSTGKIFPATLNGQY